FAAQNASRPPGGIVPPLTPFSSLHLAAHTASSSGYKSGVISWRQFRQTVTPSGNCPQTSVFLGWPLHAVIASGEKSSARELCSPWASATAAYSCDIPMLFWLASAQFSGLLGSGSFGTKHMTALVGDSPVTTVLGLGSPLLPRTQLGGASSTSGQSQPVLNQRRLDFRNSRMNNILLK